MSEPVHIELLIRNSKHGSYLAPGSGSSVRVAIQNALVYYEAHRGEKPSLLRLIKGNPLHTLDLTVKLTGGSDRGG